MRDASTQRAITAWLAALAEILSNGRGVGEIYCHPASSGGPLTPSMRQYRHAEELNALLSPRVADAVRAARDAGVTLGGFSVVFDDASGASTA